MDLLTVVELHDVREEALAVGESESVDDRGLGKV